MKTLSNTISTSMTLEEVLARLAACEAIDGVALFGSQAAAHSSPVGDYDLLLLVSAPPVGIFQMLTHIDGRMADVVFVEAEIAERLLANPVPVAARSFEGLFLLKMQAARIVHDRSGRLSRVQQWVGAGRSRSAWLMPSAHADIYAAWFWQNHGLYHLKRMALSADPVYLTAFDMMMLSCLGDACRSYFCIRHLPWQGEKAAIRHLQSHDPEYLALLRDCIAATDRTHKLSLYEALTVRTISPSGTLWTTGTTAVYLADPNQHATHVDQALAFWVSLLNVPPRSASSSS
jgi:hypothetical protein